MKNRKSTKKSLLLCSIALLLCFTMLIGTTFAWYTDSVKSDNNVIVAGNLDVGLISAKAGEVDENTKLFADVKQWEPGVVVYDTLTVENLGTMALTYRFTLEGLDYNTVTVDGVKHDLTEVIKVGVIEGGTEISDRETLVSEVETWEDLDEFVFAVDEVLLEGEDSVNTVVLYWTPGEQDDLYNLNNGRKADDGDDELKIGFGLSLIATQYTYEEDSFDDQYDKDAANDVFVGEAEGLVPSEGLAFATNNRGGYTVTKGDCTDAVVVIPATYDDKNVTTIGARAFMNDTDTVVVIAPDSIVEIGTQAFLGCSKLTSVIFGADSKLETIAMTAFSTCTLESIVIPASVKSVGSMAFTGSDLTTVYYGGTATAWSAISNKFPNTATVYYYSAEEPTTTGNYWYYDNDGMPAQW